MEPIVVKGQKRLMNTQQSQSTDGSTATKRRKSVDLESDSLAQQADCNSSTNMTEASPSDNFHESCWPLSLRYYCHHEAVASENSTNKSRIPLDLAVSEFRTSLRGIRTAMAFGMEDDRSWKCPSTLEAACVAMLNAILIDHRCCKICQQLPANEPDAALFMVDGETIRSLANHGGSGALWLLHKVLNLMDSHYRLLTMMRARFPPTNPQRQEAAAVVRSMLQITVPFVHRRIYDRATSLQQTSCRLNESNQHAANFRRILARWNLFWARQHLLLGDLFEADEHFRLARERDSGLELEAGWAILIIFTSYHYPSCSSSGPYS